VEDLLDFVEESTLVGECGGIIDVAIVGVCGPWGGQFRQGAAPGKPQRTR